MYIEFSITLPPLKKYLKILNFLAACSLFFWPLLIREWLFDQSILYETQRKIVCAVNTSANVILLTLKMFSRRSCVAACHVDCGATMHNSIKVERIRRVESAWWCRRKLWNQAQKSRRVRDPVVFVRLVYTWRVDTTICTYISVVHVVLDRREMPLIYVDYVAITATACSSVHLD